MSNDTRQKLIEAGAQLFLLKSYNGVGLKEILDSTGIPKGSFYNYFESKEDFGLDIIRYYTDLYAADFRAFLCDTSVRPRNRLKKFFAHKKSVLKGSGCGEGCLLANMTTELSGISSRMTEVLRNSVDVLVGIIADCIKDGQEKGDIAKGNANDLAEFIFNSWEGALLRMQARKDTNALEVFERFVFTLVLPEI
jgi:TetR/AcrR family transcriptional regulator, transcriptional repressor for nem operon